MLAAEARSYELLLAMLRTGAIGAALQRRQDGHSVFSLVCVQAVSSDSAEARSAAAGCAASLAPFFSAAAVGAGGRTIATWHGRAQPAWRT